MKTGDYIRFKYNGEEYEGKVLEINGTDIFIDFTRKSRSLFHLSDMTDIEPFETIDIDLSACSREVLEKLIIMSVEQDISMNKVFENILFDTLEQLDKKEEE